jgi:hypothetical protein
MVCGGGDGVVPYACSPHERDFYQGGYSGQASPAGLLMAADELPWQWGHMIAMVISIIP